MNMIQLKKETEGLMISISENRETLFKPTHRKPEETLEFKLFRAKETFHFNQTFII